MKKTILKLLGSAAMMGVIGLGVIQLNTTVAKADGCPTHPFMECSCWLIASVVDHPYLYCYYNCTCPSPGGEPMEIEREVMIPIE